MRGLMSPDLAAFTVGFSRTRHGDMLRLWPTDRGSVDYAKQLKFDPDLVAWMRGYGEDGMWDPRRVQEAQEQSRAVVMEQMRSHRSQGKLLMDCTVEQLKAWAVACGTYRNRGQG